MSIDDLKPGEWFQVPNSALTSAGVLPSPLPPGLNAPAAIMEEWSGGTYDTARNRLLVTGGGHGGYGGNEVYAFDVDTLLWTRIWGPSASIPATGGTCNEAYSDGNPSSRHTYDGLVYLPTQDALFVTGGSLYCGSGGGSRGTWMLNLASLTWTRKTDAPDTQVTAMAEYDPVTGGVYALVQNGTFSLFNPATNTWTQKASVGFSEFDPARTMVLHPPSQKLLIIGAGVVTWFNLAVTPVTYQTVTTSGGSAVVNAQGPGLMYDPLSQKIVGWPGAGGDVYSLNVTTWQWTLHAPTNAVSPPVSTSRGTYGRWQYVPSKNVFMTVNSVSNSVYFYKLSWDAEISIPTNTWVAKAMPGGTISPNPSYPEKDHRTLYNPVDRKLYIFGGDYTSDVSAASSGHTEMYSYRVSSNTWSLVHSPCVGAGNEQPGGPDEGTFVYDTVRNVFWWVPGFSHIINPDNCSSTLRYSTTMSFNPATKVWTSSNYIEPPAFGSEVGIYGFYDAPSDTITRLIGINAVPSAQIYTIATNTWTTKNFPGMPTPGGQAAIGTSPTAFDPVSRKAYVVDPFYDVLWVYTVVGQTFAKQADVPFNISDYSTEWDGQFSMRLYWDSVDQILLWPQINSNEGFIRFHTYKPATNVWEVNKSITTLPSGLTVRGNSGGYDPDQNILMFFAGSTTGNPNLYLYRYASGSSPSAPAPPQNLRKVLDTSLLPTGILFDFGTDFTSGADSDQWPMTWATDGNLYALYGDGDGWNVGSRKFMGAVKIEGPPSSLTGTDLWGSADPGGKNMKPNAIIGDSTGRIWFFYVTPDSDPDWSQSIGGYTDDLFGTITDTGTVVFDKDTDSGQQVIGIAQFGAGYSGLPAGLDASYFYVYISDRVDAESGDGENIFLCRVPKANLFTRASYEYRTASGWSSTFANRVAVLNDPAGMGYHWIVNWNPYLNCYVGAKSFPAGGLALYVSTELWGPWQSIYHNQFIDANSKFTFQTPQKWMANNNTCWLTWSGWPEWDSVSFVKATFTFS